MANKNLDKTCKMIRAQLPTDRVQFLLSEIADLMMPAAPVGVKDDFVRKLEWAISDWVSTNGGPGLLMASHWGPADARLRLAIINSGLTIEQLAAKSDQELLEIPNFGEGSLQRLRDLTGGDHTPSWLKKWAMRPKDNKP